MCGLCPDCRDHDVVSYFCSADCYRENVVSNKYIVSRIQDMLMYLRLRIVTSFTIEGIFRTLAHHLIDFKQPWT